MNNFALKIGLYAALLALVGVSLYMPTAEKKAFQKQVSAVTEGDTPILLEFFSTDCGTCMKMKPVVERMQQEFEGKVKIVTLNVDKDKVAETLIQQKFPIDEIPAFFLLDRDKKVIEHFTGEIPEQMFRQMLASVSM